MGLEGALQISDVNLVRDTGSEWNCLRGDSEAPDVI